MGVRNPGQPNLRLAFRIESDKGVGSLHGWDLTNFGLLWWLWRPAYLVGEYLGTALFSYSY